MTKHRWHACRDGECTCGYIDRDRIFALKVIGEGDHVDPYLSEPDRRDLIRRVTALLNVAEGIPTSDLEAGAVVVPVDVVYTTACLLRKITDQDGLTHYDRQAATDLANELDSVLSRLQQNGGEEQ